MKPLQIIKELKKKMRKRQISKTNGIFAPRNYLSFLFFFFSFGSTDSALVNPLEVSMNIFSKIIEYVRICVFDKKINPSIMGHLIISP